MSFHSQTNSQLIAEGDSLNFMSSAALLSRPEQRRKILLLGKAQTGKTAFLLRYKQDIFIDYYEPTIHNIVKTTSKLNKDFIEIEFIDIEGLSEYSVLSQNNFAFGINGYIFAYSITDRKSFELISTINEKIINITNANVPRILIGTKCDLKEKRCVTIEEGNHLAKLINCPFIECSSKLGYNIEKCTKLILTEINKYESCFNVSNVKCLSTVKFFMRKKYMKNLYYIFTIICLFISIIFVGFSFRIYPNCSQNFFILLGLIFSGAWEIIFAIFGILGISNQKTDFISYNFIANVFTLILNTILVIFLFKNKPNCKSSIQNEVNIMSLILCLITIVNLIMVTTISFFDYFYYRIYKKQLYSFII